MHSSGLLLYVLVALCVACSVQGFSSSSSSSSAASTPFSSSSSASGGGSAGVGGALVLSSVGSGAFPSRSFAACAVDLSGLLRNGSAEAYLLGGYNGVGATRYNDVWQSTSASFARVAQSASAPFPVSSGGAAGVLLNGVIVQLGGQGGVTGNDVYASEDGGSSWSLVTLNAPWSSRSLFASCVLPGTDIVLVAGGLLDTVAPSPPFNSSDVWTSQDGLGAGWTQVNANAPFGAVQGAAVVGTYDHSVVLCGGELNGSYSNAVWLSQSLGRTWTLQAANAPWSARSAHSLTVDSADYIYLVGGAAGSTSASPLEVWLSNSNGASWYSLQLSTASSSIALPSSVLYGCALVRQLTSSVRQLVVYSGNDATGAFVGVIAGNISLGSGVAPPSSTAIALASSAAATAKPALPSSTAMAYSSSSGSGSGSGSGTGSGSGNSATTSGSASGSSASSSSSSSTANSQTNGSSKRVATSAALAAFVFAVLNSWQTLM